MNGLILGIDTSCYTTSAALVDENQHIIASSRKLLPVKQGERGLRQSEMVFLHTKQLPDRIRELKQICPEGRIEAVCVSSRPRDDENSYMPAFHVGDSFAQGTAALLGVPCFSTTHQRGHIEAAKVESGTWDGDLLAVHLSGGTTEIMSVCNDELKLLGGTLDLHAGQVVDRTGVALGLPFPAGPNLEVLARQGISRALLKASLTDHDLNCHFSGAESQIQRWIQSSGMTHEDIAAEVYDVISRTVARMIIAASASTGIRQVLIAGGVSSSLLMRELLIKRIEKADRGLHVCFGKPEYSGDNAVGVALIGAQKYRKMRKD